MILFIDREKELERLTELAASPRAELVLLYGRRRVGKSRLLVEFARKTNALYLLADLSENILDILAQQVGKEFVKFSNWEDFFEFILKSEHKVIIIDEFQYLYEVNKAWPTILQRWWEKIKETDKKIILCGSIISTIYRIAMGYGSALYGRKTAEIHLSPLPFRALHRFFPAYGLEQLVEAYAVLGGVPRYLEEFDQAQGIEENIQRKILEKTAFLYNEPMNLLFEEFRNPAPYAAILLAITQGYVKFAEIADVSSLQRHTLPKYLLVLERAGLIEKDVPITEKKLRAKTTRYRITDNFYRFWFLFVFRNKSMIERGLQNEVFAGVRAELRPFVGKAFEDICREFLIDENVFPFRKIGKWWEKDKEVDIAAVNSKGELLFAECKWQDNVDARRVLEELKAKTSGFTEKKTYAVFAKSFRGKFKEPGVHIFDSEDLNRWGET